MVKRIIVLAFMGILLAWGSEGVRPEEEMVSKGMVYIPAGEFTMGTEQGDPDMRPAHTVYLDAYYIDPYEVSQAQYKEFTDATGHPPPGPNPQTFFIQNYHWLDEQYGTYLGWAGPYIWKDGTYPEGKGDHPVVMVNWGDARAYCEWAGKRLPTEAEWEKAARGGLEGKKYPWGDEEETTRANHYSIGTKPVGTYSANGYGLYDMAGNVLEWVADWYHPEYYRTSPRENPKGPETGTLKVVRGGAWVYNLERANVAYRVGNDPQTKFHFIGFRCAKDGE